VPAQASPGSMKMKSSCERGHNLGQHRVEAQVDDDSMTWRYSVQVRKRALVLLYTRPGIISGITLDILNSLRE